MEEAGIAFGGVVLGGLIAAATNTYFAWRTDRDRRLATAFAVFFKFFVMVDVINRICRDLDSALPDKNGLIWPKLRPLAGVRFPDASFAPEELALFGEEKGPLFAQRLLVAANSIHLVTDLLTKYNAERRDLREELRLLGLVDMAGTTGRIAFDSHDYPQLAPKIAEVEDLAKSLIDEAHKAKAQLNSTADELGPKLKSILKDKRFHLAMSDKQAKEVTAAVGGTPT